MGTVGLISYPDSGPLGTLRDMFATFAGSVNQALPVKFVPTLAALNAIPLNPASLPAGTLAVLTADNSGLSAGAEFSMHPDGKWRLVGTCTALNIDTFVTALSTYTNVKSLAGATCWNAATGAMFVFTSTGGAHTNVTTEAKVNGSGATTTNIGAWGTFTLAIAFPPGSFTAVPSNVLVTADNHRLIGSATARTKDGFSMNISNWTGDTIPTGTKYTWTAWA